MHKLVTLMLETKVQFKGAVVTQSSSIRAPARGL